MKSKYYSLDRILKLNCLYNIIIGERSNGKTFAVQKYIIEQYLKTGHQGAIVRRWEEDYRGKRGAATFDGIEQAGVIAELTDGEYDRVAYYSGRWFLGKWDDDLKKVVRSEVPFCYAFAITMQEHDKSSSYTNVKTILFDEFITRTAYLDDEFTKFMNLLSTIIRDRDDVKIFMLGNTVNKYCPYFTDMGLRNVATMTQGTIDVYQYGDSDLQVAVEYCKPNKEGKKSDKYFAFDNPKLSMITSGEWEISIYPHLPYKYPKQDVRYRYYIKFNNEMLECEIIVTHPPRDTGRWRAETFTYVHRKTTPIKENTNSIIFSTEYHPSKQYRRRITKPDDDLGRTILSYYANSEVFYQDNEVGEIVRNYLIWSRTSSDFD